MNANYWFCILSHSYYAQNKQNAIVYNTLNGEYIQISNKAIVDLLEKMHLRKNLGVIEIGGKELNNLEINNFIKESVSKEICKIEKVNPNSAKPIQLMPILNLQKEIEKLKMERDRSLGENILQYLSDVTIYLNDGCNLNCENCGQYDKQFFHCWKSHHAASLSIDLFIRFIEQLQYAPIRRLAITGGNIFLYPYFNELISYLKGKNIFPVLGIHYKNLKANKINIIYDFPTEIFVTFPLNNKESFIEQFKLFPANLKIIFEITSEIDYTLSEALIDELQIQNYEFRPFYTGNNEDFFSSNVYLTAEDILSVQSIQRIIFARQKMNTNFFGALYLYPDGTIKTNPSKENIGNFKVDNLLNIIEKELIDNTSWRTIRNKKPCNTCIYQFLCPSLSNYEIAIGKPNLCHVNR
jgi:pseudo-rSAM protein